MGLLVACGDPDDEGGGRDTTGTTDTSTATSDALGDVGDVGGIPAGATLVDERAGEVSATDQLALDLGGVRLLVPPDPALAGTTITARVLHGVLKSGPEPFQGLVVQVLPHGLTLTNAAELRWTPGYQADQWTGLTADEEAAAWTTVPATPMGLGEIVVELPHFSLWAISPSGASTGTITFAGLEDARTATDGGGGIVLRVPRATSTATRDWFGFAGDIHYFAYVSTTSGGQRFERAHAVLSDVVTDPDADWTTEYRLVGLEAGTSYCVVVRARDMEGSEDDNTVERCAVAAAMGPATLSTPTVTRSLNLGAEPFLAIGVSIDRAGVRVDFEKSLDDSSWRPFDSQLAFGGGAGANDMPPAGATVYYRARAWDGATLVGTSPSVAASLPALDGVITPPRVVAALPGAGVMRPALYLDGAGRMVFAGHPTSTPWAAADATNPTLDLTATHLDLGITSAMAADPVALWYRIRCGIAGFVRPYSTGFGTMAFARAADGDLYVSDGVYTIYRLAASGDACAEVVSTALHPSVHGLAAHPSDAAKLAAVDPSGVYVTADGAASWTRWRPAGHTLEGLTRTIVLGQPLGAVAWSPDGARLWAGLGPHLATSVDAGLTFSAETWTSEEDVAAIAVRADGVAAVLSGQTHAGRAFVLGPPGGLAAEVLPGYPSAGAHALLWLADGRLLAFTDHPHGLSGASRYLATRAPGGGFTESRIAAPRDAGAVHVDPVDDQVIYAGLLRSRDGGATWAKMSAGYARGVTTLDGLTSRLFVVAGEPSGGVTSAMRVSEDQGESGSPITGVLSELLTFDPEAPARGLARGGAFTSDGGATWGFGADLDHDNTDVVGWASATRAYASSDAEGAGFFFMTDDGGASWTDLNEDRPQRLVPRITTGNGTIAASIGSDVGGPFLIVDAGAGWSKVAPPAALVAGGSRLGGLAFANGADLDSGLVYAVVAGPSGHLTPTGCRGALWRSSGGLAGPWTELHADWTAAGWGFDCRIRVDAFSTDPDVIATPVTL
ncbi:MAG: hypothetical protein IT385_18270 [Deltaproteobacteria bacterium]|nr:hypothetical protein [Deltaproteobacteria bacterium]